MANLPSNIYSGGAVTFNSQPYAAFYVNELQRKRAKDEALDNYFLNFNKSINPAGMRTQDIEGGWMDKVNGWQSYFQQNRQAIENPKLDRGKAYNQYMAMHNDLLGDTQKSKNLADVSKQYVVPIVSNPDKRTRLQDNGVNAIHQHDVSMYDPQHKTLDPSVLEYGAKPFDIAAQKKLDQLAMSGKKMDINIPSYKTDAKGKLTITSYHSTYSPQTLKTIGDTYANAYENDDSFKNAIEDIAQNPEHLNHYDKVFSNIYGHPIENNHDLAAAWGLDRVQGQLNTQKETSFNPYGPADYEYQREKFHDFSQQDINNSIDQRVDDQISRAQQELDSQPKNTLYGKPVYLSVDPATLKAMNVENLQYVGNGTIVPVWHETINKGTPQETQVEKQGAPMKVEDWKMAEGKRNVGAKYFESKSKAQPQKSSSSTTVKSKRPPLDSYIKSK